MDDGTVPSGENNAVGLSGMIMGFLALFCALLPGWRVFAMVVAAVSICICVLSLSRARHTRSKRARALAGLVLAIAALAIAGYFRFVRPAQENKASTKAVKSSARA